MLDVFGAGVVYNSHISKGRKSSFVSCYNVDVLVNCIDDPVL